MDSSQIILQAKHLIYTSEFSTILEDMIFFRGTWMSVFAIIILFCNDVNIGSSCPEVSCKKVTHENFTKFTGKHMYQSLFFNKGAGPKPATLLKNKLLQRFSPVNFGKFIRTSFFIEQLRWLLLEYISFSNDKISY